MYEILQTPETSPGSTDKAESAARRTGRAPPAQLNDDGATQSNIGKVT